MDIYEYNGEDFKAVLSTDNWKIGLLRYSERFSDFCVQERHLMTDEAFILLEGSAVLQVDDRKTEMQKLKVYNIKQGEWHHIVVSTDATVLVVENSDTCSTNTEKREYG